MSSWTLLEGDSSMLSNVIIGVIVVLVIVRIVWRMSHKGKTAEVKEGQKKTYKPITSPWQKKLFTVYTFARINTKRYFRDKTAIFFTVAFPLILLFVFGGIFGHSSGTSFNVALVGNPQSAYGKQFVHELKHNKLFKVSGTIKTLSAAEDSMEHGSLDATIMLPNNFGDMQQGKTYPSGKVTVDYSQNSAQAGQALSSVLSGQFQGINQRLLHSPAAPFTVDSKQVGTAGLSAFDYTFSGLVGFSILGLGIFGPMNVFPELKKQGILRRFHTTPLRVWQFFLSNMISQAIIGLVTLAIMLTVAHIVFHLHVVGNLGQLAVFLVFGIVMILGIGLSIGGWARNERQAAPIGNIVTLPLMFLSGTFFPRFLMPVWLQHITNYLPLSPVIDGVRLIATEGKGLTDLGPQLGIMAIWIIVIYAVAFRVFRWE
jgi:ABC-2 type transport system permease protein